MKPILQTLIVFFCLHIGFAQPLSYHSTSFAPKSDRKIMLPLKEVAATDGTLESQIQITWPSKGYGCEYLIYRSESAKHCGKPLGKVWREACQFTDRDINPNKNYYYSVKYRLDGEESDLSIADLGFAKRYMSRAAVDNYQDFEQLKNYFKDVPKEERLPISVARFSVKTKDARGILGGELAEMLNNALTNIGCFQVLEMIDNTEDLILESQLRNDGIIESYTTFKHSKLIITGDITEFSEGQSSGGAFGISVTGNRKAHVGFIIKVLNPQTRQILYSQSIDVEAKIGGFSGINILGSKAAGSSKYSNSLSNAIENAIIQACGKLAENAYKFDYPDQTEDYRNTEINISGISYAKMIELKGLINELLNKDNVSESVIRIRFSGSIGKILIRHKGTTDELLELLVTKLGNKIEITNVEKDRIYLILKE